MNDFIDWRLELLNCRGEKEKLQLATDSLQEKTGRLEGNLHSLRETLDRNEVKLREVQEQKSQLDQDLLKYRKKSEETFLNSKQREDDMKHEIETLKEIIENKNYAIEELAGSLPKEEKDTRKSKEKKEKDRQKKYEKEKKALENKIVAQDGEISEWRAKFHHAERCLVSTNKRLQSLYINLYLLIFLLMLCCIELMFEGIN